MLLGLPCTKRESGAPMNGIRLAPLLALLIVSAAACASQRAGNSARTSSVTVGSAPGPAACTLIKDTWTCSPVGFGIGRVVLTGAQTIKMGKGGTDGQFFTVRLIQDSKGGRVPTWGSMFQFQNSVTNPENTLVPLSYRETAENILFQYDSEQAKWVYMSRSGIQQIAPTIQGAGTSLGDHPGRVSSTQALRLPANTETGVFGDNGGFFGAQGNGVVSYDEIQAGVVQFCNFDAITTLAVFRCNSVGDWPSAIAQTAPVKVPAGGCTEFQTQMVAGGDPAFRVFTGFVCFINPGNSAAAYATWNSVYNEEIPLN
jgi:hypothetical protein